METAIQVTFEAPSPETVGRDIIKGIIFLFNEVHEVIKHYVVWVA